nr:transposase, MuDR, MULE transposase domain protein [Tanacetum cinerariifolium]
MTSNSVESINVLTKDVRKLPITQLIDWFRGLLQKWYSERRAKHQDAPNDELTQWASAKVKRRMLKSVNWTVNGVDENQIYEIREQKKYMLFIWRKVSVLVENGNYRVYHVGTFVQWPDLQTNGSKRMKSTHVTSIYKESQAHQEHQQPNQGVFGSLLKHNLTDDWFHVVILINCMLIAKVIILESDYDSPPSMNSDDTWEPRKDVAKNTSNSASVKGRKGSTTKKFSCSKSRKTKPFKDLKFFDDSSSDDQGNVFRGKPERTSIYSKGNKHSVSKKGSCSKKGSRSKGVVRGKPIESDVDSVQVIILESGSDSPHSMNFDDSWEPGVSVKGSKGLTSKNVSCSKSTKTKPFDMC